MDICEKVAYLKGLTEGLGIDGGTKEGKVLLAIIDALDEMTNEICEIGDCCEEIIEQVDAIDEDLSAVEDLLYGDDECDCDCDECDDDDDLYEVECPNCHDIIYLDEDMLAEEGMKCPNCGTDLEFDFDDCECSTCGDEGEE